MREALSAARVVFLAGARQSGKTTLVRELAAARGAPYATLDDVVTRRLAGEDPDALLAQHDLCVIDEVQRGGDDLLLAIKQDVDRDPRRGRFLLTGSTRFLTVRNVSESLAGRVILLDLWPFSQGEIAGKRERFVDRLFGGTAELRDVHCEPAQRRDVFERVCRGGFPEAVDLRGRMRSMWFDGYVRTLTTRDVSEIARIGRPESLPGLVRLLAARTSMPLDVTALANDADIPRTTLNGYVPLLESVFLIYRVPAWSRNPTSKRVKRPRMHFTDSGLAAHLLGVSPDALAKPTSPIAGSLLETFVCGELARQTGWADTDATMHHFRDRSGLQVDAVLETRDGRVAVVEVKAGRSVGRRQQKSLTVLRDRLGDDFVNGVVLYCGDEARSLGDRLSALPISSLWA